MNTTVTLWAEKGLADILFTELWGATQYAIFHSAGVIWGAIGPIRFFGGDSVYHSLFWCFLVGFLLPVFPWIANKYYPSRRWQLINIPLIALGTTKPGKIQNAVLMPFLVAWIFQYYIFYHHRDWWIKVC